MVRRSETSVKFQNFMSFQTVVKRIFIIKVREEAHRHLNLLITLKLAKTLQALLVELTNPTNI